MRLDLRWDRGCCHKQTVSKQPGQLQDGGTPTSKAQMTHHFIPFPLSHPPPTLPPSTSPGLMLSARPMEPVSIALGSPQDHPSSSPSAPSDSDRLHIFTSSGRRLSTAPGSLDSSQLSAFFASGKDSPMQPWPAKPPPIHSRSSSVGNLLTVPDCDETGKLAPTSSHDQVRHIYTWLLVLAS